MSCMRRLYYKPGPLRPVSQATALPLKWLRSVALRAVQSCRARFAMLAIHACSAGLSGSRAAPVFHHSSTERMCTCSAIEYLRLVPARS